MSTVAVDFRTVDWRRESDRGHVGKRRYGRRAARLVAARMRAQGRLVSPYRCPWAEPGDQHWHVGHPLSAESAERVAAAIRNRCNEEHHDD